MTPTARLRETVAPHRALATEELRGHTSLMTVKAELAGLADSCGAPTTAQGTWLFATMGALRDELSWAVLARDLTGALVGAVVLLDGSEGPRETVTFVGSDHGQRGAVLTTSVTVAHILGKAVSNSLSRRAHCPDVTLGPLPADSPIVAAFSLGLNSSERVQATPVPVIRKADTSNIDAYLSHGMRRTIRKAANRLNRDDKRATIAFTSDAVLLLGMLPALERCRRNRDHAHGRPSDLDDDLRRGMWQHRIDALVEADRLELATLHIDGAFAAYALGVVDGGVYRLLEGRFETPWARYSPGRLLEAAVVQRMLDDPGLHTLDWMTSVACGSLLALNDADPMVFVLRAAQPRQA